MMAFSPSEINLASQPFKRERAQNAVLAGALFALVASLLFLVVLILRARVEATDLRSVINVQKTDLVKLQQSQSAYSRVLGLPKNADVFSQSLLLNQVIAKRAVSWTRVFQDLGTVLPNDMRLLSIRLPQVAAENGTGRDRVQLDMWVGAEKPGSVVAFLKRLATSPLFGDASVMTEAPPTQNDALHKYRLTVAYAQQL